MTNALYLWSAEQAKKIPVDSQDGRIHYLSAVSASFWITAFCEEVERKASFSDGKIYDEVIGKSFYDLRRELLGD